MDSDDSMDDALERVQAKITGDVQEHGWSCIGVFGDGDTPPFCYTIGLMERGWPELTVHGVHPAIGHQLITNAIKELGDRGIEPDDDTRLEQTANVPVVIKRLPACEEVDEICTQAQNYYSNEDGRPHIEAAQLVWPDTQGKFPWEPECDARMASWQSPVIHWAIPLGVSVH